MKIQNFLIDRMADLAFVSYPLILIGLFVTPFVITYFIKKRITILSGLICALIGASLVYFAIKATFLGLGYLQGFAARDIYGY